MRREVQDIILKLQLLAENEFEQNWRGTILRSVASILEAFLEGLDD